MTDATDFIQRAEAFNVLIEPTMISAIQTLQLPPGSQGLDAGCGIGLQALLLAQVVGPRGHVTGLDISPELFPHAEEIVNRSGLSERISFQEGDVSILPFDDGRFDWAWSSCCAGYAASLEPFSVVKEP